MDTRNNYIARSNTATTPSKANKSVTKGIWALPVPTHGLFRVDLEVARVTGTLDPRLVRRDGRLGIVLLPVDPGNKLPRIIKIKYETGEDTKINVTRAQQQEAK